MAGGAAEGDEGVFAGDAAGYDGMKQLLQCSPRPDGVFCANDPIAMGAMRAILEAGLKIPQDIAVVGCGNLHYDDFLLVPLTSIDQDSSGIGETAEAGDQFGFALTGGDFDGDGYGDLAIGVPYESLPSATGRLVA